MKIKDLNGVIDDNAEILLEDTEGDVLYQDTCLAVLLDDGFGSTEIQRLQAGYMDGFTIVILS